MWKNKKVAVIFPTYREKDSIYNVIKEFDATGFVDEIIVVDNNAEEGTQAQVKKTRAKLIFEKRQGYGYAIRTGIAKSNAELMIIAEPDGTYDGNDVTKLLAYSDDFEIVFGSRTHVPLIHSSSEMSFTRRILDVLLGKMITVLFMCPPFTDVGCTLRLTSRKGWKKVARECQAKTAMLATEWLLVAAKNKVKFIDIPINFRPRVGISTQTATIIDQASWAIRIFLYIWWVWIQAHLGKRLYNS